VNENGRSRRVFTNFLYPFVLEAIIVFAILSASLLIEFNARDLLTEEILILVLKRTALLTLVYLIIFRIAKTGVLLFVGIVSSINKDYSSHKPSLLTYLTDIFITLLIIITTSPVRPILQKVNLVNGETVFDYAMVRFDAIPTMFILSIIGLPLIVGLARKYTGFYRIISVSSVIVAILLAGYINNKPNYDARIYETRANWITRDWVQQEQDAEKALQDAETNSEKAFSYYWLGVAANRQGRTQEAIDYQLKAVEADESYGPPHSSLAISYTLFGDFDAAKEHADRCITLSPGYAWCYYALAAYYDNTLQKDQAYINLKRAIELDPNAIDFQNTLEEFKLNNPNIVD